MRRTFVLATALACSLGLGGCGFIVIRSAKYAHGEFTKEERAVDTALSRYRQLVVGREIDKVADMFDLTAELAVEEQAPVRGRDAIRAFLQSRGDEQVVEYELTPSTTTVSGASSSQRGTYRQTLRTPAGQETTVQGRFDAQWVRQANGPWLIRRLHVERQGA